MVEKFGTMAKHPPTPRGSRGVEVVTQVVDVWSQPCHFRRCGHVGTPQHIWTYEADYTHPRRASRCTTQRRTRVSRLVR